MASPSFVLLGALLLAGSSPVQNILGPDFAIRYGDEPAWYAADHRPDGWDTLDLGLSWETQGLHNYDTACLRRDVVVPAALRTVGVRLEVRQHAEATDVYVNGRQVMAGLASDEARSVVLPVDLVRWGETNRVALRVREHRWTGGDVPDFVRLLPASGPQTTVSIAPDFPREDHEFSAGEPVRFPVRLTAAGADSVAGRFSVSVVSDFHEKLASRTEDVTASSSGSTRPLDLGPLAPGFYLVRLRFSAPGLEAGHAAWLAVSPTRIASAPAPVVGFDTFWERTRRELAAVAPAFRVHRDAGRSTPRHDVYSVEMASLGGLVVRAWYVVPTQPGPFPAVLHVPGYSVAMRPEDHMMDDDVVHLALDVRGHGRSADVVHPGFGMPGYVGHEIHDADRYVYRGAYMDCGRALEFLGSRSEVDGRRIAVEGMSQGGGLAYATAALFPEHVAACAAGVPFLGDFPDHIRIRTVYGEEMRQHLKLAGKGAWEDTLRSMNLVDPRNLAPRVKCPVLMAVALFDDDCPPHIGFAVYNNVTAPKQYLLLPDDSHLMNGKWPGMARQFVRRVFGLP